MYYKNNKYYIKNTSKHKDIKNSIELLENFCNENCIKMEIHGSLIRNDYYYGKSDCDVIIITKNIDNTSYQLDNLIYHNPYIEYKKVKLVYYGLVKDKIELYGLLYKVNIHENKFDIVLIEEKDYINHKDIIIHKYHYLIYLIISIIKFLYYKIQIIPFSVYKKCKKFFFKQYMYTSDHNI